MELVEMDLMKKKMKRPVYSKYQKWLSVNFMVASTNSGSSLLSKMLPLPSVKTCMRELKKFKSTPGISSNNSRLVRLKVPLTIKHSNYVSSFLMKWIFDLDYTFTNRQILYMGLKMTELKGHQLWFLLYLVWWQWEW